jgi:hypothetical protein
MAEELELTSVQRERLQRLTETMQIDRITVSFSLEGRGADGMKKSAFCSLTASKRSEEGAEEGWAEIDAQIARLLLCKQVVRATYEDAVRRGILSKQVVVGELTSILAAYDRAIQRVLSRGDK